MLLQGIEHGIEILVRVVDLGHDEQDVLVELLSSLIGLDRTDMNAGLCRNADNNGITCIKAFVRGCCEIEQTRNVEQVDLVVAVFKTREREID